MKIYLTFSVNMFNKKVISAECRNVRLMLLMFYDAFACDANQAVTMNEIENSNQIVDL